jgi:quinoprotein glucose dehydrogenase
MKYLLTLLLLIVLIESCTKDATSNTSPNSNVSDTLIVINSLSKTSAIYIFDAKNGDLLNYDKKSTSIYKLNILDNIYVPQSIDFSIRDIDVRSATNNEYINKLMKRESDKSTIISTNKPHAFYGIHGGAEWFGGAYSSKNSILVVPMNRYPWFIRSEYTNNSSIKVNSFTDNKLRSYQNHCAICHGIDLEGLSGGEMINSDNSFIPSLIGRINDQLTDEFLNKEEFDQNHKFAVNEYNSSRYSNLNLNFTGNLSDSLHEISKYVKYFLRNLFYQLIYSNKNVTDLSSDELGKISNELIQVNNEIINNGGYSERRFFQPILDRDYLPITKPPWGELVGYNIKDSKLIWRIPFGFEKSPNSSLTYNGSRNFGGVLMTDSDILFANGTTDEFARAYDALTGTTIWESKLPFAGSSPPMTFIHNECQYIVFNATGGRYKGFKGSGDATVAYKISDCLEK